MAHLGGDDDHLYGAYLQWQRRNPLWDLLGWSLRMIVVVLLLVLFYFSL